MIDFQSSATQWIDQFLQMIDFQSSATQWIDQYLQLLIRRESAASNLHTQAISGGIKAISKTDQPLQKRTVVHVQEIFKIFF